MFWNNNSLVNLYGGGAILYLYGFLWDSPSKAIKEKPCQFCYKFALQQLWLSEVSDHKFIALTYSVWCVFGVKEWWGMMAKFP